MKKKNIKIGLGLAGIGLAIVGWFFSNTDQISWLQDLISPHVTVFKENVHKIQTTSNILKADDGGFKAIAKILTDQIDQAKKPQIITITTKKWGWGAGTDDFKPIQGPNYEFYVLLHTGQILSMTVWNLEQKVADYFQGTIYLWSSIIFWIGIFISIFSILRGD